MTEDPASVNILVAYPYLTQGLVRSIETLRTQTQVTVMLDSGAFTAWQSGKPIVFEDYIAVLRNPPMHVDHAVQLDVVGDAQLTRLNYDRTRDMGIDVLPVFTRGAPLSDLEYFYSKTDYVLFGGIVQTAGNREYITWFTENNARRKVHWLGFTDRGFLAAHRPYSADSSSWHSCMRHGAFQLYKGRGVVGTYDRRDLLAGGVELSLLLRRHGVDDTLRRLLSTEQGWRGGRSATLQVSACAALLRLWDVRRVLGTRLFLAASVPAQVDALASAFSLLEPYVRNLRNHLAR